MSATSDLEFALFVLAYLTLWLLPWAALAWWVDRPQQKMTVAGIMTFTALCAIELAAGAWLGYPAVFGGIVLMGFVTFLPAAIAHWMRNRAERRGVKRTRRRSAAPPTP